MFRLFVRLTLLAGLFASSSAFARTDNDKALRVAVILNSPPMSYMGADGQLTGFNVELARELCATMQARCDFTVSALGEVVDAVSRGQFDFAAVSLVITPDRGRKVLFSKPYYRSLSAWVAPRGRLPGAPRTQVAVVRGSVQAAHARAQGWSTLEVGHHVEIEELAANGKADAALLPMLTTLSFLRHPAIAAAGWEYQLLSGPGITGEVGFAVAPARPELRERLNQAIDRVRADGRFDRINSAFLPFRLQ
jgi:ABC-type amino acid transport substrate-binding protein